MIEFAGLSKIHHETGKVNVRDFTGKVNVSDEDMWNPLCFHGTGLHLPTRRRRWQSVKGIQVWNPKKHSHSCSSWQLPMVAVHAGPRHLLGIMVL